MRMSEERITLFAEILLPLPIPGSFTYRVPYELNDKAKVGQRAVVQFGKTKIMSGLIMSLTTEVPDCNNIKYLLDILDDDPVVNAQQLQLWNWISSYYLCYPGEVMQAALPSALKLSSESKIMLSEDFEVDSMTLSLMVNAPADGLHQTGKVGAGTQRVRIHLSAVEPCGGEGVVRLVHGGVEPAQGGEDQLQLGAADGKLQKGAILPGGIGAQTQCFPADLIAQGAFQSGAGEQLALRQGGGGFPPAGEGEQFLGDGLDGGQLIDAHQILSPGPAAIHGPGLDGKGIIPDAHGMSTT